PVRLRGDGGDGNRLVRILSHNGAAAVTPRAVASTAPDDSARVSDIMTVAANASGDTGVVGVQLLVDGADAGVGDATHRIRIPGHAHRRQWLAYLDSPHA